MKRILSLFLAITIFACMLPVFSISAKEADYEIRPMLSGSWYTNSVLKTDGSVWSWGENKSGQIGNGSEESEIKEPARALIDDVCRISSAADHVMALKTDGTLWGWGDWSSVHSRTSRSNVPFLLLEDVRDFSARTRHAIKNDNTLWMWKENENEDEVDVPYKVMDDVESFYSDNGICMVIKTDKSLWSWDTTEDDIEMIKMADDVKKVYQNYPNGKTRFCYVLKTDNSLWECSREKYYSTNIITKKVLDDVKIFKFESMTFAIKNDNTLWCYGQSELDGFGNCREFTKIMDDVKNVYVPNGQPVVLMNDNTLYSWKTHSALPSLGYKKTHRQPYKLMDNVFGYIEDEEIYGGQDILMTNDGVVWELKWDEKNKKHFFEPITRFADFVIQGESTLMTGQTIELNTVYYNDDDTPCYDNDVTWYCYSDKVEVTNMGSRLKLKGLKEGSVQVDAVHNQTGEVARYNIQIATYKLSLEESYAAVVNYDKELDYTVSLKGEEMKNSDISVSWRVENTDGSNKQLVKIKSDFGKDETLRRVTIECKNKGECNLIATINGSDAAPIHLKVYGSIYETAEDESVIRAKVLFNNNAYKYYTQNYKSAPSIITENMDITLVKFYDFFDKIFENGPSTVSYYELVLWDILTGLSYKDSVDNYGNYLGEKLSQNLLVKFAECADGESDDAIFSLFEDDLNSLLGNDYIDYAPIIETLYLGQKLSEEAATASARSATIGTMSINELNVIEEIKKYTDNKSLKKACDNIIEQYSRVNEENFGKLYKQTTTFSSGETFLKEKTYEGLLAAIGADSILISSSFNDLILNVDDISAKSVTLCAYTDVEDALSKALENAQSSFVTSPNLLSAGKFMTLADMYKSLLANGCMRTQEYINAVKDGNDNTSTFLFGDFSKSRVLSPFGKDIEYDEFLKTTAGTQKTIINANFYSTGGIDIASYIGETKSVTPSQWAEEEINSAISAGLLPDYMQKNYQNNITRAEFCTLLTQFVTEKTNKEIEEVIKEKGTLIKSPFEDTYYEYVDYMYKFGVVSGVGEGQFDPLGEITREQAATMLMRTAQILGYDVSYSISSYEEGISDWAKDGVGFTTEAGIMKGTNIGFEPKGTYTKEQAVITLLRMYNFLK